LIPQSRANFAPLSPLFSNSSSNDSRRSAVTLTRPRSSCFKISAAPVVGVIDPYALTFIPRSDRCARADAYEILGHLAQQLTKAACRRLSVDRVAIFRCAVLEAEAILVLARANGFGSHPKLSNKDLL